MEQPVWWGSLSWNRLEKEVISNLKINTFQMFFFFFFLNHQTLNEKKRNSCIIAEPAFSKKNLPPEELGASLWCATEGRFKPPWRGAAPVFSPHCPQLTFPRLLKQLQLQIRCFTYISSFPLPSTLRPKFLLQPHKLLWFDLQKFLLKIQTNKPTPNQQTAASLGLKANESSPPHPPRNA